MNKKLKIAIGVGTTLALGIGGYFAYRKFSKTNIVAKSYLKDVDENGGNVPVEKENLHTPPANTRTLYKNGVPMPVIINKKQPTSKQLTSKR